jgi:hypothetical protein
MQLSVDKIMAIEGIIVRHIQRKKREVWRGRDGQTIKYKENELGGKYLVQFNTDQGSVIHFSVKYDGIGDTIPEAFNDYLEKNRPMSSLYP